MAFDEAMARVEELRALETQAQEARLAAAEALAGIEPWAGSGQKAPHWALLDRAADLERRAQSGWIESTHQLHLALKHWPGLLEARQELVRRYRDELAMAEEQGDAALALRARMSLEEQVRALPSTDGLRESLEGWLDGTGRVTLLTEPAGAVVTVHRYVLDQRRLQPGPGRVLA